MKRRIAKVADQPAVWLSLLLVWVWASGLRSWHTPWAAVAATETLRWTVGLGLALAVGQGLHRLGRWTEALTLGLGLLVAAILGDGRRPDGLVSGPYQDHQLCASALLALLPFSAALAVSARQAGKRGAAQIVTVTGLVCLALTGTRAAWAGAVVGGLVFAGLWSQCSYRRTCRVLPLSLSEGGGWAGGSSTRFLLPVLMACGLALAFGLLVSGSDFQDLLAHRAATWGALGRDESWQGRLLAWQGAGRMIAARPLMGWGVGRYPALHWAFAPLPLPGMPGQRPSLSDQAHDLYLQTAAELGLIGLGLYLSALLSTARLALQALSARHPHQSQWQTREALLVAALALLAGQGVDALASPSWQFAEVSLVFWLGLGLTLAALRVPAGEECDETPLPAPARRWAQGTAFGAACVLLTAQLLPLGLLSPAEAYNQPSDWTLSSLTVTGSVSSVTLPFPYTSLSKTVTYTMTAIYQITDSQGDITYSAPMTFTFGADCQYRSSGISLFVNNVLSISKSDDPAIGQTKTYTITATLTDNNGPHSATTTLMVTNN